MLRRHDNNLEHHPFRLFSQPFSQPFSQLCRGRGSIPLEMALITPLALLLLFVGLDAGLAYMQKTAIIDALRSGMNTSGVLLKNSSIVEFDPVEGSHVNESKANEVVSEVLSDIRAALARIKGDSATDYKIRVQAIVMEVDPNTGIVTDRARNVFAEQFPLGGGDPHLPEFDPGRYHYQALEDYLDASIRPGSEQSRQFAIPETPSYQVGGSQARSLRFLPFSVVLVGEVQALTNGINTPFARSVLGKFFAVAEKQIVPLRTQLM